MNEVVRHFAAATEALRAETWAAWRLGPSVSYPIDLGNPESLDEAVMQAMGQMRHPGDMLAVQCSHVGRGRHILWQFKVQQSSKIGIWRDSTNGGRKVFVGRLEAKLLSEVALASPFAPVEPFDAFRDDPRGRDLSVVEGDVW